MFIPWHIKKDDNLGALSREVAGMWASSATVSATLAKTSYNMEMKERNPIHHINQELI